MTTMTFKSETPVLPRIFHLLPRELKLDLSKADVFFILSLESSYLRKIANKEFNPTTSAVDFIVSEAKCTGENFTPKVVQEVLKAKEQVFKILKITSL